MKMENTDKTINAIFMETKKRRAHMSNYYNKVKNPMARKVQETYHKIIGDDRFHGEVKE